MITRKEESALRIMEALSGVDEELLERCGQPESFDRQEKKMTKMSGKGYGFMHKYGSVCAACLCLAVLGTAWWKISQQKGGAFDNGAEAIRQEDTARAYDVVSEEGTEAWQESLISGMSMEESAAAVKYMAEESAQPEWLDWNKLAITESPAESREETDGDEQQSESILAVESLGAEDNQSVSEDRAAEISWEEACAVSVLGQYVPAELPEGYLPLTAKQNTGEEERDSLVLTWGNGEHILWLKLTETELDTSVSYSANVPILKADEEWQGQIPEQADDGSIQFALLCRDGVLLEYKGWLTTDEIVKLLRLN